jgi:hypothetical protein
MMEELPRQILADIITRYGQTVCEGPSLQGLLSDYCKGQYRREIFVLVSALRERVAADLLAASEGSPKEILLARLTQRLVENLGFTSEVARWAVESWALALGKLVPPELATASASRRQQGGDAPPSPPPPLPISSAHTGVAPFPSGEASPPPPPPPPASDRRKWLLVVGGVLLAALVAVSYGLWREQEEAQHRAEEARRQAEVNLRQEQEAQRRAEEETAKAVDRFAVTCIRNGTDEPINYLHRWGDGEWKNVRLMPGAQHWHARESRWPHELPQLQMRFDADLSSATSWIVYDLESYASPQKDDCESGKNYEFHRRGFRRIDLAVSD